MQYTQRTKVRVHIRQYVQEWINKAVNMMDCSNSSKTTEVLSETINEDNPSISEDKIMNEIILGTLAKSQCKVKSL